MIYFHYQDYSYSFNASTKLDAKIENDAYKVSNNSNYAGIVALSARQAVGGIVLAESVAGRIRDGEGSKPLVFLKEISSDGNMQTVDVIFPAYAHLIRFSLTLAFPFICTFNLRFLDFFLNRYSCIRKLDYIPITTVCTISAHRSPMQLVIPKVFTRFKFI